MGCSGFAGLRAPLAVKRGTVQGAPAAPPAAAVAAPAGGCAPTGGQPPALGAGPACHRGCPAPQARPEQPPALKQ
eukprot:11154581-Lingulodinium_polyedra.AAC.1